MTSVAHLESSVRLGAATAAKDAQTLLNMGDKSVQLLQMYNSYVENISVLKGREASVRTTICPSSTGLLDASSDVR